MFVFAQLILTPVQRKKKCNHRFPSEWGFFSKKMKLTTAQRCHCVLDQVLHLQHQAGVQNNGFSLPQPWPLKKELSRLRLVLKFKRNCWPHCLLSLWAWHWMILFPEQSMRQWEVMLFFIKCPREATLCLACPELLQRATPKDASLPFYPHKQPCQVAKCNSPDFIKQAHDRDDHKNSLAILNSYKRLQEILWSSPKHLIRQPRPSHTTSC